MCPLLCKMHEEDEELSLLLHRIAFPHCTCVLPAREPAMGNRQAPAINTSSAPPEPAAEVFEDMGSGLIVPQISSLFSSSTRSKFPDHPFLRDAFQHKSLPKEIQLLIVSYVDFPVSACRLAQTCKHFRTLVDNHPKWNQLACVPL